MITEDQQTEIYLKLRDIVHMFERASMEEKETSFAHWSDGEVAIEGRESFDGSIAAQFLTFAVMPAEHWVDSAFHRQTETNHWVDFKHNRNDRPPR
jgi:hypothetical protein